MKTTSTRPSRRNGSPARKVTRRWRPLLEVLEDRLAPAGNLLVTSEGAVPQYVRQFTPAGAQVSQTFVPNPPGDTTSPYNRDLVADPSGKLYVFNGTFTPSLSIYDPSTNTWSQRTFSGWSTANNTTYGGIGLYQNYVFVTDMTTGTETPGTANGIVRFNLLDGTATRFATGNDFIDLNVGLDGKVYALAGTRVSVYDPSSMALLRTVPLYNADYRGLAVNAAGEIFTANYNGTVSHFTPTGTYIGNAVWVKYPYGPAFGSPMDIDVAPDGTVAVSTTAGYVVELNSSLSILGTFNYYVYSSQYPTFVTFVPPPASQPSVNVADVSVTEGNAGTVAATFTVSLTQPSAQTVTVDYASADGTAAAGGDYQAASGTLIFPPGQTSQTVTVLVNGDTLSEANETFTLNLSNPTNAILARAQGTGTVVDDDPLPLLSINDASVTEGNSGTTSATFTVTLSAPSGQTVRATYITSAGTATSGTDYGYTNSTVVLSPGQTSTTVTVPVIGDTYAEPNETFYVTLSVPINATLGHGQATGTILNDDTTPGFSVNNVSVTEGNSGTTAATFTVSLSAPSTQTTTVNYATADGTATTAGADYQAAAGTLTFAPGQTSQAVTVLVNGDTYNEAYETFSLNLSAPTNATLVTSRGTGTIANDDPLPTITVDDTSVLEGNSGTTPAYFTVRLSAFSGQTVTVGYATAAGTATAGTDYSSASGMLTFLPGETSRTVPVSVIGDGLRESNEKFYLNLSGPGNATLARSQATGTIVDDDNNGIIEFTPTAAGSASDPSGSGTYSQLSSGSSSMSVYHYDGTPPSGLPKDMRALMEFDTRPLPAQQFGSVTFSFYEYSWSGSTPYVLVYGYAGDGAVTLADATAPGFLLGMAPGGSGTGWFTVTLDLQTVMAVSSQTGFLGLRLVGGDGANLQFFGPGNANGPKLDFNPGTPAPKPTIVVNDVTIAEGTAQGVSGGPGYQSIVFYLTLDAPSTVPVSVGYQTANGTAVAGSDYIASKGVVIFNPGETQKTLGIAVAMDSLYEADETFFLQLTDVANAMVAKPQGTATLRNDDAPPALSVGPVTVTEGNSGTRYAVFTVTASGSASTTLPFSVSYTTTDGTATAGQDYTPVYGTLNFAPGQTSATVSVPVLGDTVYEPDETFSLVLQNPVNATVVGSGWVTGTILNDDAPPVLSVAPATLPEGDSGTSYAVFNLTLSGPSAFATTVDYATADGTATAGQDYAAASGTVIFYPGQTSAPVLVAVTGDKVVEPDETLLLNLSNVHNATLAGASATGTVLNDDHAPVAAAGPDQTADEGALVQFDAGGSSDADGDPLTFTWDFGDGSGGSGVSPTHAYADNGVYTVTVSVSDGANVSAGTLTVTVQDVAPTAAVSGPADGVPGQNRTFTFSATDPSPADTAAPFTYQIDWGDGSTQTVQGPASGVQATHAYAAAGSYAVTVTAADKDGSAGAAAGQAVSVVAAELQGGDLFVGGTTGDDQITVQPVDADGTVDVVVNGQDVGTFVPTGQVVVYGQAGNDVIQVLPPPGEGIPPLALPVLLFGGEGDDTLDAGGASGPAVLAGGAGNDTLLGGSGRSMLVGGAGADVLHGGADDDLVIAGTSSFETDLAALTALRAEWARTDADYPTRIGHLNGSLAGGLNGRVLLTGQTVVDDTAVDDLFGDLGQDWFFAATAGTSPDLIHDLESGEITTGL